MTFVRAGGGLFMISDHTGSDRNNDGADSVTILNDLMGTGDPFVFDRPQHLLREPQRARLVRRRAERTVRTVTGTIIRNGTTATLHPSDNPAVKGEVYRGAVSPPRGKSGAAFATSTRGGSAYWGDSSPISDGTGQWATKRWRAPTAPWR